MTAAKSNKPYRHGEYFAALDGFRGLLAVFVAIYHTIWLTHVNSWAFFDNGAVIIDLFFALSGFLMFHLYGDKINDAESAKKFMKRRFARLYPLHLFMLAIFVAFSILRLIAHKIGIATHEAGEILPFMAGAQDGWGSLFANLTLTHAMGVMDSLTFNPPSWTISAEFYTYFVFMAVILWAKPKKLIHFIVLAIIISAIYAGLSYLKPNMDITYDYAFFRCIAGFFTGLIAAKAYRVLKPRADILKAKGDAVIFTLVEIVLLLGSILFVVYCGGKLQFFVAPILFLFILIFAFDGGMISRFMSGRVFRYLAKISYSVYMTHVIISIGFSIIANHIIAPIIPNWNMTGWGGDMLLIPYLMLVIGFSHVTYHIVEVKGGHWVRNFKLGKSSKRTAEPA